MAELREEPYKNFNFLVDLETGDVDTPLGGFVEVVLPAATADVIEFRTGNSSSNEVFKLPGLVHYGNLVLKRGLIGALDLYEWWSQVLARQEDYRRTVTVSLQNEDRSSTVFQWRFRRAWPSRYRFSRLEARGKRLVVEVLELAIESMEIL